MRLPWVATVQTLLKALVIASALRFATPSALVLAHGLEEGSRAEAPCWAYVVVVLAVVVSRLLPGGQRAGHPAWPTSYPPLAELPD